MKLFANFEVYPSITAAGGLAEVIAVKTESESAG